ncbi:MAG: HEAT repeat domain-containing protein [Planctomycetes bacterium]|nr:HEAT repeat domain-containing protein [Planctomycetota bacterium]MCC7172960.1 HEAT repeat domain-containing protein [Planctomycetota bacterium]
MSSVRTLAYPVVALAILAGLILLKPRRTFESPIAGDALPTLQDPGGDYRFVHPLSVPEPPEYVLRARFQTDRVRRLFDRIEWGPQDLYPTVDRALERMPAIEQRRYVDLVRERYALDPIQAAKHLTRLGNLEVAEAEELVLEAALASSAYVRMQATRALLVMDTARGAQRLEQLLADPDETVRREAIRSLSEMQAKEAIQALQRYADLHPDDGIRHVLTRIAETAEDPTAIPTLRKYVDEPGDIGKIALKGLARFGDLLALERLKQLIVSPNPNDQAMGIAFLQVAPRELVDPLWVEPLLMNPFGDTRRDAVELLAKMALSKTEAPQDTLARLLEKGASDPDARVLQAALVGLYALGRKDVAEPYLKAIEAADGLNLSNALELTTHLFEDPRAAGAIRERWARVTDTTTRALLLIGMSNLGENADIEPLLDAIRGADVDEPRDADGVPLSFRAAQLIGKIGKGHEARLLQFVRDRAPLLVQLRALDAIRGIPETECLEELLDLLVDGTVPLEVRIAIVDTLPACGADDTFERLLQRADEIEDRDLGQHILRVAAGHL